MKMREKQIYLIIETNMKYKSFEGLNGTMNVIEGDYSKSKRALSHAQYRLLAAFLGVLTILTLYGYIGIAIAQGADMFVPK